jgi:hypothetical protein
MVGFIKDNQVPVFSLDELFLPILAPHEVTGNHHQTLLSPFVSIYLFLQRTLRKIVSRPEKGMPRVRGNEQVEFLIEFSLPLPDNRLGNHDEDATGELADVSVANYHAGLDGFSKAYLIGDEKSKRPSIEHAPVNS